MRLIFLYTQCGAADDTKPIAWQPKAPTRNFFAVESGGFQSEGYAWLLKRLKETKVFDDVLVFIESNRYPGTARIYDLPVTVIPLISYIYDYLRPDDIIWVRGGFRSWFVILEELRRRGHWLMLYAANTGRQRWPIWDVILDDYIRKNQIDRLGRFWFKFNKPIHPDIFYPQDLPPKYDICVGASHIHDRKGQWRTIEALKAYKDRYRINLKAIMPGKIMRGVNTRLIPQNVARWGLDVAMPGMMKRPLLNEVYNQSKLFVYLGESGQNDRGPLEALRCGTPLIIANPRYHQPEVYENPFCRIANNRRPEQVAETIHECLKSNIDRKKVFEFYQSVNGEEEHILPTMSTLFRFIKEIEKPNATELNRRLSEWNESISKPPTPSDGFGSVPN